MVESGVDGGKDYALAWCDCVSWIISNRGFFLLCFFFYNHIMLVKVMDVTIFQCIHTFPFLCGR
jgi:hypothetical protein